LKISEIFPTFLGYEAKISVYIFQNMITLSENNCFIDEKCCLDKSKNNSEILVPLGPEGQN